MSLEQMAPETIAEGLRKLAAIGVTPERWQKLLKLKDSDAREALTYNWPGSGFQHDAREVCEMIGLTMPNDVPPAPAADDGQVVLYYGGWSLKELRESAFGRRHIQLQPLVSDWMKVEHRYDGSKRFQSPPGYYRLTLPVLESNRRTLAEQRKLLTNYRCVKSGYQWKPAPTIVLATALLIQMGHNRSHQRYSRQRWDRYYRCREAVGHCRHHLQICLDGYEDLVLKVPTIVNNDNYSHEDCWMAASSFCKES